MTGRSGRVPGDGVTVTGRHPGPRRRRLRGRPSVLAVGAAGAAVLALALPAAAQDCGFGKQLRPNLGIRTFHCTGGSCMVSGARSTTGSRFPDAFEAAARANPRAFSFTVEPRLWEIDPEGPAAGKVHGGDILVAVNGDPITTSAGSGHLTRMMADEPVTLTLRRGDRLVEAVVEPRTSCHNYMASAGSGEMPRYLQRRRESAATTPDPEMEEHTPLTRLDAAGLVLAGAKIVWVPSDEPANWWFVEVPTVVEVRPGSPADQAGIRPGEQIVTAGGIRVTEAEGAAALAAAGRREDVQLFVRRGTNTRRVTIHGE